ncbi:MAG TPA: efflux RND transporter permease subunit, partial [Nannocystaceae bacterium]|nr:efflux RND transporter permease subunit [Nannocystaceae bacterium]
MLARLVQFAIQRRWLCLVALVVTLAAGAWAAMRLPIDAIPDISPVQVAVLTRAPGYASRDVERVVTIPLENALNGVPGMEELRSVSRGDLSAITIIFRDDVDPWFARQLVLERLWQVAPELPDGTGPPELAPLSNGLGEIYQFVVRSKQHSPRQLRTLLDWEVVPRLRRVPGVIEVNTMGGQLKQYQVVADPAALRAQGIPIGELVDVLRAAAGTASGGYVSRGSEAYTLRVIGQFEGIPDIEKVVVRSPSNGAPILVEHLAEVRLGAALPLGVVTQGDDGAVTGIVMMLVGSNTRDVIYAVKDRIEEIEAALPGGVEIEAVYDRAAFVERTLGTVMSNLVEGAAVVTLVLVVMLGSVRGAVVIVLGIPSAMAFAIFGMHLFGVSGDLMSLGAIDFGFLVDGPIVMLEAVLAAHTGRRLAPEIRRRDYGESLAGVMRPVVFAVAIILLVYLPLLGLEGVEGKMFRPMAITMACALFGALVYSIVFLPALLVLFVPPPARDGARWLDRVARPYVRALPVALRLGGRLLAVCGLVVLGALALMAGNGADFVPRIDEGDAVVAIRRAPSIDLHAAQSLDALAQAKLREFPEVLTTLAMTGRAEVATDPVGMESTDILVHLRPREEWTT